MRKPSPPQKPKHGNVAANNLTREERGALIDSCVPWAFMIAKRFLDRGLSWDELKSAALFGLVTASVKFQPEMGFKFSTYSQWWVRQTICFELKKLRREGFQSLPGNGHVPRRIVDTDKLPEGALGWYEILTVERDSDETRDFWDKAMPYLPGRLRAVADMRFAQGLTLFEAGEKLGLTRERVRQLQKQLLGRLRYLIEKGELKT